MKTKEFFWGIAMAAAFASGCSDESETREAAFFGQSERGGIGVSSLPLLATGPVSVDIRRSLAVTDATIVSAFKLTDVLNQLASQGDIAGVTGVQLFKQLWDTQNPRPGLTNGPHCDDTLTSGQSTVNTYPYPCRPAEGAQAQNPAAEIAKYKAIGLFNRFDLSPLDGANCGEHRIIFARNPEGGRRNFIIFEAVLANPHPEHGLEGCRPVANFWASLSLEKSAEARKTALIGFYFNGIPGFSPVIHIDNYGNPVPGRSTTGQIRTNQFLQSPWTLREFKLAKSCSAGSLCSLHFYPTSDKTNPFGPLFSPASTHPARADFQGQLFPSQVANLAVNDVNQFSFLVPDRFNAPDSVSQAPSTNSYTTLFNASSIFASSIQTELNAIGSTLTPTQIVARAQSLSCAGCHQLSNNQYLGGGVVWPSSLGFVHVSEQITENGPDGSRFGISSALTGAFLPWRKMILDGFVNQPSAVNK